MQEFGYASFLDKVDWTTLTFRQLHALYMVFDTSSMQAAYTHTQFINARRLSRKGHYRESINTLPTLDTDLLEAHTWFVRNLHFLI